MSALFPAPHFSRILGAAARLPALTPLVLLALTLSSTPSAARAPDDPGMNDMLRDFERAVASPDFQLTLDKLNSAVLTVFEPYTAEIIVMEGELKDAATIAGPDARRAAFDAYKSRHRAFYEAVLAEGGIDLAEYAAALNSIIRAEGFTHEAVRVNDNMLVFVFQAGDELVIEAGPLPLPEDSYGAGGEVACFDAGHADALAVPGRAEVLVRSSNVSEPCIARAETSASLANGRVQTQGVVRIQAEVAGVGEVAVCDSHAWVSTTRTQPDGTVTPAEGNSRTSGGVSIQAYGLPWWPGSMDIEATIAARRDAPSDLVTKVTYAAMTSVIASTGLTARCGVTIDRIETVLIPF